MLPALAGLVAGLAYATISVHWGAGGLWLLNTVGYGLILTATGLLVQANVIKPASPADRLALKWHAYMWDPWFLIWGIFVILFVILALWRSRPASQDHLRAGPRGGGGGT
jgi:hypothetical protein